MSEIICNYYNCVCVCLSGNTTKLSSFAQQFSFSQYGFCLILHFSFFRKIMRINQQFSRAATHILRSFLEQRMLNTHTYANLHQNNNSKENSLSSPLSHLFSFHSPQEDKYSDEIFHLDTNIRLMLSGRKEEYVLWGKFFLSQGEKRKCIVTFPNLVCSKKERITAHINIKGLGEQKIME